MKITNLLIYLWLSCLCICTSCKKTVHQVTCKYPLINGITSISRSSAVAYWPPDSGATSYRLRYRVSGDSAWTYSSTNVDSFVFWGLMPNTSYEWWLQSNCLGGISQYDGPGYFTTSDAPATIYVTYGGHVHRYESSYGLFNQYNESQNTVIYGIEPGTGNGVSLFQPSIGSESGPFDNSTGNSMVTITIGNNIYWAGTTRTGYQSRLMTDSIATIRFTARSTMLIMFLTV